MMHDFYGGGWVMMFFMLFFWLLLTVGVVLLVMWMINQTKISKTNAPTEQTALETLKQRYAKGEINKEEFEEKKKGLS